MRFAGSKILLVPFLWILATSVFQVFAAEEKSVNGTLAAEFSGIKMRLARVEQVQKDILVQKDKILAEIDRVRIWVRHSGSKPKTP